MTDIKFTFEDGSEAIAHYGVKGMKWRHRKSIDPEEFGYENSKEGLAAVYDEQGLNRHMTQEAARRKTAKSNAKYKAEAGRPKSFKAFATRRRSEAMTNKLVKALPTKTEKANKKKAEANLKRHGFKKTKDGVWRKNRS